MQSRYYDPEVGRFISADGIVNCSMGLTDINMFAYCGNMPINNVDPRGNARLCAGDFFGAESSVVHEEQLHEKEYIPPILNLFIKVTVGSCTSFTTYKAGDASKPISVYAEGRSDNWLLSSAGLNINVDKATINVNLGLDDVSIRAELEGKNQQADSFAIVVDISNLKVGVELASTIPAYINENQTYTHYTNFSVTAMGILATAMALVTGDASPLYSVAYSQ